MDVHFELKLGEPENCDEKGKNNEIFKVKIFLVFVGNYHPLK